MSKYGSTFLHTPGCGAKLNRRVNNGACHPVDGRPPSTPAGYRGSTISLPNVHVPTGHRLGPLYLSVDAETAAALMLPLLAYKVAATINGQKLQWYLDAAIALALATFISLVAKSL
mmetsp:Transcript_17687/g.27007  ORF Transcript_17687/g.27007 Transcript_17687/m.27007 type:complete len:116 (+) Transcript_17687:59-406(+)|eukprot:CAMPEP_0194289720 /NCGR_PEP_ID=MMETSP0169-20130528/39674_1 /TAXON_ID=218684 /ORGANISM="Corethron pennatum, Strain L29A3" /LENGTH=115 /DNA_ID=CAMNT_0039037079 /DNA_START=8 /DNA_END=355 /DNA_ORIENTATION=+